MFINVRIRRRMHSIFIKNFRFVIESKIFAKQVKFCRRKEDELIARYPNPNRIHNEVTTSENDTCIY